MEWIERRDLDAAALMRDHPPRFAIERKRAVMAGITAPIVGTLRVSRWRGSLPDRIGASSSPVLELAEHHFAYPPDEPGTVRWHLNFADAELFVAYGSSLLAQDELQVLEHPVLGALREALVADLGQPGSVTPRTREGGTPTPVLVRGAVRSLALRTAGGLYGNAFALADPERIRAATTYLDPPSVSNILAMEAPPGGMGTYDRATIRDVLLTAHIGFSAAIAESRPDRAVIHTGGWGTGAYGGDPTLMALLQLVAARLAGVEHLVFHALKGADAFRDAQRLLAELPLTEGASVDELIDAIAAHGFRWGVSDGN